MMVIKHLKDPPKHVLETVGARQDVLIWDYGLVTGHVVAVQVLPTGGADLVVEFEVPQPVVVPDNLCDRMQACRFDAICPYLTSCEAHICGFDCGDCHNQ